MTHGMISAPQPEAVEAGALMMKCGGNAIDAAVACALVQGVVDPLMCSIAGVGMMQIYMPKDGVHECINFAGKAPAAAREDMWADLIEGETRDGFGFRLRGRVNEMGYQSISVPSSLKAYWEAATAYASMDWADLVQPAIDHAEAGFLVRPTVHAYITQQESSLGRVDNIDKLNAFEATRKLFFSEDGTLREPGARIPNPNYAQTLRRIAAEGAEIFYSGEIAEEIAAEMARNGGLIALDDLNSMTTTHTPPLWGEYNGYKFATSQPPGAGLVLIEMLNILENFDLASLGHNSPDYIRILAEAIKYGIIDKAAYMGDPAFVDIPVDRLTGKAHAKALAEKIESGAHAHVERMPIAPESKDTTQVSTIDEHGNAVTMTHTLGMPSGVISENLGFMYNGSMGIFDPRPGRAASIAPGKGYTSSMTPTIVFRDDNPYIVIGAPGATHITLGVMQVILNILEFGMPISDAIAAPRFSVTSNAIDVSNRIPRYITDQVEEMGYEVRRSPNSYGFAGVHGVMNDNGVLSGAADPGRDGMALGV
ncbi:MAG: gamma-glutamyltransferase [Alphaproteobacteria bacterium]|nr:gamma-glutamyltransferase [Alphaproteobacteria bacterium]